MYITNKNLRYPYCIICRLTIKFTRYLQLYRNCYLFTIDCRIGIQPQTVQCILYVLLCSEQLVLRTVPEFKPPVGF